MNFLKELLTNRGRGIGSTHPLIEDGRILTNIYAGQKTSVLLAEIGGCLPELSESIRSDPNPWKNEWARLAATSSDADDIHQVFFIRYLNRPLNSSYFVPLSWIREIEDEEKLTLSVNGERRCITFAPLESMDMNALDALQKSREFALERAVCLLGDALVKKQYSGIFSRGRHDLTKSDTTTLTKDALREIPPLPEEVDNNLWNTVSTLFDIRMSHLYIEKLKGLTEPSEIIECNLMCLRHTIRVLTDGENAVFTHLPRVADRRLLVEQAIASINSLESFANSAKDRQVRDCRANSASTEVYISPEEMAPLRDFSQKMTQLLKSDNW